MELEEYQSKYNALETIIKEANKNISALKADAKNHGFYFADNQFKIPKTILACVVRCLL